MGASSNESPQSYITSREACDRTGFSRPSSFLRSWRAAGLAVYELPSGRKVVAVADLEIFITPEASTCTTQ